MNFSQFSSEENPQKKRDIIMKSLFIDHVNYSIQLTAFTSGV